MEYSPPGSSVHGWMWGREILLEMKENNESESRSMELSSSAEDLAITLSAMMSCRKWQVRDWVLNFKTLLTLQGKMNHVHAKSLQLCSTLCPMDHSPARLLCPWDFPGKNTGVGYRAFLQGIFLTQGLNPCLLHLLHWQVCFLSLVPPGKPWNEWMNYKGIQKWGPATRPYDRGKK